MKGLTSIEELKAYIKRQERRWTLASVQAKKLNADDMAWVYKLNAKALNKAYHELFKED